MQVNDGDSLKGSSCHDQFAKYCNNGKPKSRAELARDRAINDRDKLESGRDDDVTTLPTPASSGGGGNECDLDCQLQGGEAPTSTPDITSTTTETPNEMQPTPTSSSSDGDGSVLIHIAGALLVIQLAILDTVLAIGIIAALNLGPLGWFAELILVPLEVISLDLTIYAGQMAATGSTDHDPLLLIHGLFPDFLPYTP